jgi:hypothetical protein
MDFTMCANVFKCLIKEIISGYLRISKWKTFAEKLLAEFSAVLIQNIVAVDRIRPYLIYHRNLPQN